MKEYFQNKASVKYVSADGHRNMLHVFQPFFIHNAPIIIIMPALGVKANYYDPLAFALQQKNYIAITTDLRGNGESSRRPTRKQNFGYHELLNYDWPAIIEKVNKHFPGKKIYLLGHSLGGQLNVLYAGKQKLLISGLILVASCTVYYKGWKFPKNIGLLVGTQLARILVKLIGYFPGEKIGFAGTEAKNIILDWANNARNGKYRILNSSYNYEQNIKTINLPVLAIYFQNDTFAPEKAVRLLCSKMPQAKLSFKEHDRNKKNEIFYNHFNWVKNNDAVVETIVQWLNINFKIEN